VASRATPIVWFELSLLGLLRQVDGELLQGLPLLLGVGVVDALAAAHLIDGLPDHALAGAGRAQQLAGLPFVLDRRKQKQLAGDILIVALLGELVGEVQQLAQIVGDMDLAGGALDPGHPVQCLHELQA
jgi:hypothetical protein